MKVKENPFYSTKSQNRKLFRSYNNMFLILFLILIAGIVVIGITRQSDTVINVSDENEILFELGDADSFQIAIADIDSIEFVDSFECGKCKSAKDGNGYQYGIWTNEMLGEYQLVDYNNVNNYIVVHTKEKNIVFNYLTKSNTVGFYDGLLELMEKE